MTVQTLNPSREFANAVRLALSDLPPEEVDDLTDGLEADLAEQAADGAAPDFGDPMEYANELRLSAGLPPRGARKSTGTATLAAVRETLVRDLRRVAAHPAIAAVLALLVALRPLWWILRAWVLYGILCWAFHAPSLQLTPLTFVLGAGVLLLSVQWGRGKWLPRAWMRTAFLVLNVLVIVTLPITWIVTSNAINEQTAAAYDQGQVDASHAQNGLIYNGRSITNIFAYDASGQPLKQVQLYDQSGRPLYTVEGPWDNVIDGPLLVPNANVHGRGGWNVYPLGFVSSNDLGNNDALKKGVTPAASSLPSATQPALKNAPKPAPTPTPTATPAP